MSVDLQRIKNWKKWNWPYQLLEKDLALCNILQDNSIFTSVHFFSHEWRWENDDCYMLVKEIGDKSATFKKLGDLKSKFKTSKAATWIVLTNFVYTEEGLVERELWEWKKLEPVYHYPKEIGYAYIDFLSSCWEFEGFPGFGLGFGNPHGHVNIEICDGSAFYSLGQYPHPEFEEYGKVFMTQKAVIMSPDGYLTSRGEKIAHRFHLGDGKTGKSNCEKLIQKIEELNKEGIIHNASMKNCSDFAMFLEEYVKKSFPETKLVEMEKEVHFVPHRKLVKKEEFSSIYHYFILFLINILLNLLFIVPFIHGYLGRGKGVELQKNGENFHEICWKSTKFPRVFRMNQLFHDDYKGKSARFITE